MASVIYCSHGSYLAPADLMGGAEGEAGGEVKGYNLGQVRTEEGTCPFFLVKFQNLKGTIMVIHIIV